MTRDRIIFELIALEAQLRAVERMAGRVIVDADYKARIPPILGELARSTLSLMDRVRASTDWRSYKPQERGRL